MKPQSGIGKEDVELVERIVGITEELTDIVAMSQKRKKPKLSINIQDSLKDSHRKFGANVPVNIYSIFRTLVLNGLVSNRLSFSAYVLGKNIGLSTGVKNVKKLKTTAARFGIKNTKFAKFDRDDIVIIAYGSATSSGIKEGNHAICFFEAGLLSGLLEKLLGVRVNLEETKCIAKGNKYCQFELYKQKLDKPTPATLPLLPADVYSRENVKLLTTLASHAVSAIENVLTFEETRRRVVLDGLTEIYNYRYFNYRLMTELKRADRHKMPLSLIMLDIDNFKKYNDTHGHQAGDDILRKAARFLFNSVRDIDIPCRYGGDEFALILPQTDQNGAMVVAKRLTQQVKQTKIEPARELWVPISFSQGVTTYISKKEKTKPRNYHYLIKRADQALLQAKKKRRGGIVFLPS